MPNSMSDQLDLVHVFDERLWDFGLDGRQRGVVIPGAEVRSILGMLEGGERVIRSAGMGFGNSGPDSSRAQEFWVAEIRNACVLDGPIMARCTDYFQGTVG